MRPAPRLTCAATLKRPGSEWGVPAELESRRAGAWLSLRPSIPGLSGTDAPAVRAACSPRPSPRSAEHSWRASARDLSTKHVSPSSSRSSSSSSASGWPHAGARIPLFFVPGVGGHSRPHVGFSSWGWWAAGLSCEDALGVDAEPGADLGASTTGPRCPDVAVCTALAPSDFSEKPGCGHASSSRLEKNPSIRLHQTARCTLG
nr:6-phosphofructo-2-kinase/fructose-2,6-bisphosphatase 3 isoform X1 [Oryctolagus cuniculus]